MGAKSQHVHAQEIENAAGACCSNTPRVCSFFVLRGSTCLCYIFLCAYFLLFACCISPQHIATKFPYSLVCKQLHNWIVTQCSPARGEKRCVTSQSGHDTVTYHLSDAEAMAKIVKRISSVVLLNGNLKDVTNGQ